MEHATFTLYRADCILVPRHSLLDLQTNPTYERALGTELVYMLWTVFFSKFLFLKYSSPDYLKNLFGFHLYLASFCLSFSAQSLYLGSFREILVFIKPHL